MKVAFIYGDGLSSWLTKFFTQSTAYHVLFTDGVYCWDMHKTRRRRTWTGRYDPDCVVLIDTPVPVDAQYLDEKLASDKSRYGYRDYLLFGMRWAYHLVGQSTRNYGGTICSEMIADDLAGCWWPVRFEEVPSPADLELALLGEIDAINTARWAPFRKPF